MGQLDGKVAIVTGGGQGLGRVEALALAKSRHETRRARKSRLHDILEQQRPQEEEDATSTAATLSRSTPGSGACACGRPRAGDPGYAVPAGTGRDQWHRHRT